MERTKDAGRCARGSIVALALSLTASTAAAQSTVVIVQQAAPPVIVLVQQVAPPPIVLVAPTPPVMSDDVSYGTRLGDPRPRQRGGRHGHGAAIAGGVLFGVSWLSCGFGGLAAGSGGTGFIPLAGPLLELGAHGNGLATPLLILDDVVQLAGLVTFIVGLATRGHDHATEPSLAALPMVSRDAFGVQVGGTF